MATRTTAKKVNNWYMRYAELEMLIDMDEQGLFCDVPSETKENEFHRVHVDETTVVPVAVHCSCSYYEHKGSCKHQTIVDSFYARIYKSNVEKAAKHVEVAPIVAEVEVEQKQAVAVAEAIIAAPKVCGFEAALNRPRRGYVTELIEKVENKAEIAAQMRETVRGNFGTKAFSKMR